MKRKTIHKDFKFLSNLFVTSASPHPQHTSLSPFPCFLLSFPLSSSESFKSIGSCHSVQNPPLASHFTQNKSHSFYKAFQYRTPPSPFFPHCLSLTSFTTVLLTYFNPALPDWPFCRSSNKPGILSPLGLCISNLLYLECSASSYLHGRYLTSYKSLLKHYLHESYPDDPINTAALSPYTPDLSYPALLSFFITLIF